MPPSLTPMPPALPPPPLMAPLAPMPMLSPLPAPLPVPTLGTRTEDGARASGYDDPPLVSTLTPLPGVIVPTAPPRLPRATLDAVRATTPTQLVTAPHRRAPAEDQPGRGPNSTPARGTPVPSLAVPSMYDDLEAPTVATPVATPDPLAQRAFTGRGSTPAHTAQSRAPGPRLTAEEQRLRKRARMSQRREWARDLLRRFQF
jgi:hypothetical protein